MIESNKNYEQNEQSKSTDLGRDFDMKELGKLSIRIQSRCQKNMTKLITKRCFVLVLVIAGLVVWLLGNIENVSFLDLNIFHVSSQFPS